MEALVNTDYETVKQTRDILLRCESKLADIVAKRKGNWGGGNSGAPCALATAPPAQQAVVRSMPLPKLANPNAMDVDCAWTLPNSRKCFKCRKRGHLMADCLLLMALIRAVIAEALGTTSKAAEGETKKVEEPAAGFV